MKKTINISKLILKHMYITMLKIRMFEEKVADLIIRKEIACPCHLCVGQEAVAAGVCAALDKDDYIFSTHRSHGHYIAKGGSMKRLMAELYGKETGCSRGQGGSMHLSAPEVGFMGSSAIVSGSIPLAVGAALAFKLRQKKGVVISFFGDGAVDEGVFYESLNFAALKKLPVVFICENNLYSSHLHISARQSAVDIYNKARLFNIPGSRIDGNDVVEIYRNTAIAVKKAQTGKGPSLIECMTYRWRGHVGPNLDLDKGLRNKTELSSWMARCPIKRHEKFLLEKGKLSKAARAKVSENIKKDVLEAIRFAKSSPYPKQPNNIFI